MSYQLTLEARPGYLHARVTGERTPENALRFLQEVYAACVKGGSTAALMEMAFSGPSLPAASIYNVISARAPEGAKLRKIAYVQPVVDADEPDMARFAETVARNRGVNVRLFANVAAAERWLSEAG
jgi:hypothetical protein